MRKRILATLLYFSIPVLTTLFVFFAPNSSPAALAGGGRAMVHGRLPLYFIENRGQVNSRAKFYETGPGHTTFFTRKGVVLSLCRGDGKVNRKGQLGAKPRGFPTRSPAGSVAGHQSSYLSIGMVGMNKDVRILAEDAQPGKVNYFRGSDPRKWLTAIPTYGAVLYKNAYPGIDVKFYGNNRRLEYDIIVAPGADPSKVRFTYSGAKDVHVTATGDLAIGLGGGRLVFKKPSLYQKLNGEKVLRQGKFVVRREKLAAGALHGSTVAPTGEKLWAFTCSFKVCAYDRKLPLVIDPVMLYSTFLGGSANDEAYGIAVDSSGNAYMTGVTNSIDFPTQNVVQSGYAGGTSYGDAFVTEIAAGGQSLVYSTYLGGTGDDIGYSIAVDGAGNAYATGWTNSSDFPITPNDIQPFNGGGWDAFVTEIAAGGKTLIYSTYLGGAGDDYGTHIAVDGSGNAYVAGRTYSTDFPHPNGFQSSLAGEENAFVAKIESGGKSLLYSTYLGGNGYDEAWAIAVDGSGNAYVAGLTTSTNFPTVKPFQSAFGGGTTNGTGDAFVAEIAADGQSLVYSTYLGGSGDDAAYGIALDSSRNVYVTGSTQSSNFPLSNALQPNFNAATSYGDAFVAEIAANGQSLTYSTYLGGTGDNSGNSIAVDGSGNAFIAGATSSVDFPVANALQSANRGGYDAFVAEITAGGASLAKSTYLGGSGNDAGYGIALDNWDNAYVTGTTESKDFPTANAYQPSFAGGGDDAFLAVIAGLWGNATNLGSGWMSLGWFGRFYTNDSPWIYHENLGWLLAFGTSTDNIWFYDPLTGNNGDFWWTSASVYPYLYRASNGHWYWYLVPAQGAPTTPRWFVDLTDGQWVSY
ncbi:MAG: SBBP repeat-containing protein [Syntrophobacteraceae bacterium]|nr:SBBP repeat-containing protein [Syntrophobacteraceae bacterium]